MSKIILTLIISIFLISFSLAQLGYSDPTKPKLESPTLPISGGGTTINNYYTNSSFNQTYSATTADVNANRTLWFITWNNSYDAMLKDYNANLSTWRITYNVTLDNMLKDFNANRSLFIQTSNGSYYLNTNPFKFVNSSDSIKSNIKNITGLPDCTSGQFLTNKTGTVTCDTPASSGFVDGSNITVDIINGSQGTFLEGTSYCRDGQYFTGGDCSIFSGFGTECNSAPTCSYDDETFECTGTFTCAELGEAGCTYDYTAYSTCGGWNPKKSLTAQRFYVGDPISSAWFDGGDYPNAGVTVHSNQQYPASWLFFYQLYNRIGGFNWDAINGGTVYVPDTAPVLSVSNSGNDLQELHANKFFACTGQYDTCYEDGTNAYIQSHGGYSNNGEAGYTGILFMTDGYGSGCFQNFSGGLLVGTDCATV